MFWQMFLLTFIAAISNDNITSGGGGDCVDAVVHIDAA
jgi:hypothetical protein